MTMDAAVVVAEMAARFQTGDLEGAYALFHEMIRIEQPDSLPHRGVHIGALGLAEMGTKFSAHWERTITDPHIFGGGEHAVQLTTQTWTSKATGRSATTDVAELMTVQDGLIVEIRVFPQDTAALLATLGQ
jgi:ketosteroid isomerase-like protein